jgi:hypothetical protein
MPDKGIHDPDHNPMMSALNQPIVYRFGKAGHTNTCNEDPAIQ